jgi:hypothetical protein
VDEDVDEDVDVDVDVGVDVGRPKRKWWWRREGTVQGW